MTSYNHPARSSFNIPAVDYSYPHNSWADVMQYVQRERDNDRWMVYFDHITGERQEYSFQEFVDYARTLSTHLVDNGIERGSRVAIAGHNHPDTIALYFACWFIGACAVPINVGEDDNRISYILKNSEAKCCYARSEYHQRMVRLIEQNQTTIPCFNVDTDDVDSLFVSEINPLSPLPFPDTPTDMRWDECMIVYTSGTTGNPKGVVLIQQNLFADGYDIAEWHGVTNESTMMCVLPVHHVNGTIVTHVTPFLVGASVVLHRKFSPSHFFTSIAEFGVNIVSVVPTLLAFVLEAKADIGDCKERGFRHIICGAGPLTCDLAKRFEETYNIPIVHGYGLSETTCYTCFLPPDLSADEHHYWMQHFGFPSIGVALPCNEMAIHDPNGFECGPGLRGEIVARGPNIMKEYFNNPEANQAAFEFGWFRSGDEGFYEVDERGRKFYFITGRLKELIIRGGVNLAPLEIDEVINKAPGVKAGISVGFENSMYGEEVGALVVPLKPDVDADEILEYCAQHLPYSKTPKVVVFADELPVTSTGKFQRIKVRHLFSAWKNEQFTRKSK